MPIRTFAAILLILTTPAGAVEVDLPTAPDAPTHRLPAPSGPHAVGVRAFGWIDPSRPEFLTPDPGDLRETAVQIW